DHRKKAARESRSIPTDARATLTAMSTAAVMSKKRCGAKKHQGAGTCKLPAGHGTDHVGRGRCKLHGGSTPDHRKKAAREEALDFVRNAMGAEVSTDPLEALLQAVRLAAGAVAYWRVRPLPHQEGEAPADLVAGLDGALDR